MAWSWTVNDLDGLSLDGDVARASRWKLVGVDEETLVRVAWVEGEHAVVDVLLQAFAAVARSQGTARGFREQARFNTLGLGVVGHILNDHTPFTIDVLGADWASVFDIAGADETFTTNPVTLIELFAVVERVIEFLFLLLGDTIDQIIGRLIGNIGVFLQD